MPAIRRRCSKVCAEALRASRPRRHPGQQRRRRLGRAGRRPSARGLGQGDEPERAQHLPVQPGRRQGEHDPAQARAHHQHRVDRRPGRQPAGHGDVAYNTSKGAVVNFTRALAAEWGEHGITVNAHRAGLLPEQDDQGHARRPSAPTSWHAHAPLRRLGDDDDLKGAALLFASDAGKHITGQILAVDGGVSVRHRRLKAASHAMSKQRIPFPIRIPFVEQLGVELLQLRATARPRCASTSPSPPELVGGGARRRADDAARRGDGACRAQRANPCDDRSRPVWPRSR